ncbi:MAG: phytanoyl-CoA dioxygenase family protein [Isosphaeraceae bacterium]
MTDALDRDGFLVVPGVLEEPVTRGLIDAIQALVAGESASTLDRGGSVYGGRHLLGEVPLVREVAGSAAVRDLVEPVLGEGAFAVRGLYFDKSAGANWMVPWHQDLTIAVAGRREVPGYRAWTRKAGVDHVQPPTSVLEGMLTVRLHLDDCGPERGPLRVVPGSHRGGRWEPSAVRDWLTRVPARACHVSRGGAILMRPLLLHASSPAEVPSHRRVVHLEFAAEPLPGGLEWFETVFFSRRATCQDSTP